MLEPGRTLAWDTTSSGARWIWELEPDGPVTGRARASSTGGRCPRRLTLLGRAFAPLALGGNEGHADELEAGMAQTVAGSRRPRSAERC